MIVSPAFTKNNISIVFSTDPNFVPYLAVALQSLLDHTSSATNYDIWIMEENLEDFRKQQLLSYTRQNISIRFINMSSYMEEYKDSWYMHDWGVGKWHSLSVYYRFFIPEIFREYEKIVFLDGDIVVNCDIAELFNIDLNNKQIAAVKDYGRNVKNDVIAEYAENTLGVSRTKYFNAGILVFNLKKIEKTNFLETCLETLKKVGKPKLQDQDIFNIVFRDQVLYLDYSYNCLFWNIKYARKNAKELLDPNLYNLWEKIAKNPKIFHYAGSRKPWKEPQLEYANYFWEYARQTPFYEEILLRMVQSNTVIPNVTVDKEMVKHISQRFKYRLRYLKYKLLKPFTFGKLRKKYKSKKKKYKQLLKQIKNYLK